MAEEPNIPVPIPTQTLDPTMYGSHAPVEDNVFTQDQPEVKAALKNQIIHNISEGKETRPALAYLRKCQVHSHPGRVPLRPSEIVPQMGEICIGVFATLYQIQKNSRITIPGTSKRGRSSSRKTKAQKAGTNRRTLKQRKSRRNITLRELGTYSETETDTSDDYGSDAASSDLSSDPEFVPASVRRKKRRGKKAVSKSFKNKGKRRGQKGRGKRRRHSDS